MHPSRRSVFDAYLERSAETAARLAEVV